MRTEDEVTLRASFRRSPFRTSVLTVLPVLVAVLQLANSVVGDLSIFVGLLVAMALIGAAVVFTRHHIARLRLESVEANHGIGSRHGV